MAHFASSASLPDPSSSEVVSAAVDPVVRERVVDSLGRSYATGKRKTAIARVRVKRGSGKVLVNGKDYTSYFSCSILQMLILQPILLAKYDRQLDVDADVHGGGFSGQAGAIRYGIAKALVLFDPVVHSLFRPCGLLTRDSRIVERKKYGRRKARRSFQFSKR